MLINFFYSTIFFYFIIFQLLDYLIKLNLKNMINFILKNSII